MTNFPKASVIVLAWNGADDLPPCLESVLSQDYPNFEVIVVDNGSQDDSVAVVRQEFPQVQVLENGRNLGFSGGNNVGLRAATGEILVLLNQDTVVHDGWLSALVVCLSQPGVGMAGCKIFYPDGTLQHAGGFLDGPRGQTEHYGRHERDEGQWDAPQKVDFVTAAAVGITRSALAKVGFLDEGFSPAYYEDLDWCYRVRASGFAVRYCPQAQVIHAESKSTAAQAIARQAMLDAGRLRFVLKHQPLAWLKETFLPAEQAWLESVGHNQVLMNVRQVYLHQLLNLPEIFAFRQELGLDAEAPDALWADLVSLLLTLRQTCTLALETPQSLREPDSKWLEARNFELSLPDTKPYAAKHWAELESSWQVEEQPFESSAPVVGPAIAGFRSAWNNVATRWYVLPLLKQQNLHNWAVMHLLKALEQDSQLLTKHVNLRLHEVQATFKDINQRMEEGDLRLQHTDLRLQHALGEVKRNVNQNLNEIDSLALKVLELERRLALLQQEQKRA